MSTINEFGQTLGEKMNDFTPPLLPPKADIHGTYCRLEPLNDIKHADDLWKAYSLAPDGRDWTYLFSEPPTSFDNFKCYLQDLIQREEQFTFTVVDQNSNIALGLISYMRMNPAWSSIEIGNVNFSRALQRTRISTETVYLMMKNIFDNLGYRRLEWKCNNLNVPSKTAALRFGFSFEGVFKKHMIIKGHSRDTAWFSMIDEDWPSIKAAFSAWLDAANFDASGNQVHKLSHFMKINYAGYSFTEPS